MADDTARERWASASKAAALLRAVRDVPIRNIARLSEPVEGQPGGMPVCVHCGMLGPDHGPRCNRPRTVGEAMEMHCEPGRDFLVCLDSVRSATLDQALDELRSERHKTETWKEKERGALSKAIARIEKLKAAKGTDV